MTALTQYYDRLIAKLSTPFAEAFVLLFVRITLAGIFWRSGRTKVADGSLLKISDNTIYQFDDTPFNNVPLLSPNVAAHLSLYGEHLFPILLVIGLFTRMSALALLGMTLVIQLFVFPEAWWPVHSLWVALALVIILRGGGILSLDALLSNRR
jgi:putative oxidoreductase